MSDVQLADTQKARFIKRVKNIYGDDFYKKKTIIIGRKRRGKSQFMKELVTGTEEIPPIIKCTFIFTNSNTSKGTTNQ